MPSSVVFPEPFEPSNPVTPGGISAVTSVNTRFGPHDFVSAVAVMTADDDDGDGAGAAATLTTFTLA